MNKPYFPGLHTLRAYAACSVIVSHVAIFGEAWAGDRFHWSLADSLVMSPRDAVSLFLVLSGFLITYLLLFELRTGGKVDIAAFYRRRVLRIWPLYFGMLALCGLLAWAIGGVAFREMAQPAVLVPLLTFTLNLALVGAGPSAMLVLWSVGMEEQFYAVWPWLVQRVSVPKLAVGALVLWLAVIAVLARLGSPLVDPVAYSRYPLLTFGALAAWGVFRQHPLLRLAQRPIVRLMMVSWFVVTILADADHLTLWQGAGYDCLVGLMSALLIINIVDGWGVAENRVTHWLGNISYGMYVLHPLVIFTLISLGVRHELLYITAIIGTIGVASVSYRYFERPFLRLKYRFEPRRTMPLTASAAD